MRDFLDIAPSRLDGYPVAIVFEPFGGQHQICGSFQVSRDPECNQNNEQENKRDRDRSCGNNALLLEIIAYRDNWNQRKEWYEQCHNVHGNLVKYLGFVIDCTRFAGCNWVGGGHDLPCCIDDVALSHYTTCRPFELQRKRIDE